MEHRFDLRVYYEDTDLAGIVYYANYLRFIERGRTEMLRGLGIDQVALRRETGVVFAVRKIAAEYLLPAVMDDHLTVISRVAGGKGARLFMEQAVMRGEETLFTAEVEVAAMNDGRATRIPKTIRDVLLK